MMAIFCGAIKENGEPCRHIVGEEGAVCIWHDTSKAGRRKAKKARVRGGASTRKPKPLLPEDLPLDHPPRTAVEAHVWSGWFVVATASGLVTPEASAKLATAINTNLRAQKQADLEREISNLKKDVAGLKAGEK